VREIVFDMETTGFEPSDGHRPCGFCVAKVAIKETMRDA
jgi:hypothetical protein